MRSPLKADPRRSFRSRTPKAQPIAASGSQGIPETLHRLLCDGVGGSGNLGNIAMVATGGLWGANCAVSVAGNLYCWGSNSYGQMGTLLVNATVPNSVLAGTLGYLTGMSSVAVGGSTSCAVSNSGSVYCP